jgi:hypothetical protein
MECSIESVFLLAEDDTRACLLATFSHPAMLCPLHCSCCKRLRLSTQQLLAPRVEGTMNSGSLALKGWNAIVQALPQALRVAVRVKMWGVAMGGERTPANKTESAPGALSSKCSSAVAAGQQLCTLYTGSSCSLFKSATGTAWVWW